jgi:hypothetical protein
MPFSHQYTCKLAGNRELYAIPALQSCHASIYLPEVYGMKKAVVTGFGLNLIFQ